MENFQVSDYLNFRVVAVVVAKNEEHTIAEVVAKTVEYVHHVIVMDGHSTDQTAHLAQEAGGTVYQDPGLGKGSALRMSINLVDADIIVFLDSDGSHDPADIPRLVAPIVHDDADLCIGSRFTGGSEELSISFGQMVRTIGNISMNILINKRWNTALTDTLNGFRAVRKDAVQLVNLKENRHTIEQEMVMKMLNHGYRVINVPTHEYERQYGVSHINIWKEWPIFVWCVVINLLARKKDNKTE